MQNDQTYSKTLDLIKTKDDLLNVENSLDSLEKSLYEKKKTIPENLAFLITNDIPQSEANIANFKKSLQEIKILEITVAKTLNSNFLSKLSLWLSREVHQRIALDIKIAPELIAGAVINFNGKYFDGSLRLNLANTLKKYV